ncbi:DEKNAAC100382 [Brettanomyces naardenensis]|uniref:Glycerophosphocholine acyltransferase 1 n=1 Tax=Brettanomyces naardenensis TaxID=13370 RepID=A0A448YF76_BRENA|nr:DEKNAAC100382 [Brettanomyces naardenensis]
MFYGVKVPESAVDDAEEENSDHHERKDSESLYSVSAQSTDTSVSTTPELNANSNASTPTWRGRLSSASLESIPLLDLLNPSNVTLELRRNHTYTWMKNYGKKLNDQRRKKLHFDLSKDELKSLKNMLNERFDKAYIRIHKTTKASQTEKVFFAVTTYIIFLCGLVIGKHPEWFHVLYTVLFAILMPIRIIIYYKIGYAFFLADLCYYVNVLLLIYIWILPSSKMLFVICSSFSFGTLSFAVITWRNKLVLHSIEKSTSTFIHVLPGVVMYVITHQLPYEFKVERFPGSLKLQHWEFMYGILYTSIAYFVWQLSYHYFITIRRADQIKNGQVNSFEYLRKAFAKKPIGKFVNSLPEPFPVVAFTLIQYGYQLTTMSLCPIFFQHKYAASAFVSFIFLTASYNGATYYVDFYGKRLQNEVIKLQKELNKLQSKLAAAESSDDLTKGSDIASSAGTLREVTAATTTGSAF